MDKYVRKQVLKSQQGKAFPSKEAKRLDVVFKEVGILSNQLAMTLVNTRQKLQPFVDEGVVHKDRKKATKKNVDEVSKQRQQDSKVTDKIREYREAIQDAIQ